MGITREFDVPSYGTVQTTDATVTDVPNLTFTIAQKSLESFEIEAWGVRNNSSGPNVLHQRIVASARRADVSTADLPTPSAGTNPTSIFRHALAADSGVVVNLVATGTTVKVQVTGLATTTIDWTVRVTRTVITST